MLASLLGPLSSSAEGTDCHSQCEALHSGGFVSTVRWGPGGSKHQPKRPRVGGCFMERASQADPNLLLGV